jgi:hypothetical protein
MTYINWCQSNRNGIACEVGYMGNQTPHQVDEFGDLVHRHANSTWVDLSHNREATPTDLGTDSAKRKSNASTRLARTIEILEYITAGMRKDEILVQVTLALNAAEGREFENDDAMHVTYK